MCLFVLDCFIDSAISEEDPWCVFTCPAQPLLTFSILSPGSPVPPVQVCFTIALYTSPLHHSTFTALI